MKTFFQWNCEICVTWSVVSPLFSLQLSFFCCSLFWLTIFYLCVSFRLRTADVRVFREIALFRLFWATVSNIFNMFWLNFCSFASWRSVFEVIQSLPVWANRPSHLSITEHRSHLRPPGLKHLRMKCLTLYAAEAFLSPLRIFWWYIILALSKVPTRILTDQWIFWGILLFFNSQAKLFP